MERKSNQKHQPQQRQSFQFQTAFIRCKQHPLPLKKNQHLSCKQGNISAPPPLWQLSVMLSWAKPGKGKEPCSTLHKSPSPAANFRFRDIHHLIMILLDDGSSPGQSPWLTPGREDQQFSISRENLPLLISSAMK